MDELTRERFLFKERGSGTRQVFEELFQHRQVQPPAGMEISSDEKIKQAVIARLGIALVSAAQVASGTRRRGRPPAAAVGRRRERSVVAAIVRPKWGMSCR